jgi:hypothetical protein
MNKLEFMVDGKKYYVRLPNQREMNEGDLVYKTKYSEALRFGALTTAESLRIIEERKIYGPEDDVKIRDLFFKLYELGKKLMETSKFAEGADLIFQMERVRTDILRINMRKNNILDNTAESYADEHRLQFYTVVCTFHENGQLVFKNVDEYLERATEEIAKTAITKTIHLIANEGKDFRAEWPEYQWRIKQGLVDEQLNPLPENTKKLVEEANKEITEEVTKVAKRKYSKKKDAATA